MIGILILLLEVYKWLIFARVLLSWLPNISRNNPIVQFLYDVTEPVLAPARRIIPPEKTAYLDLSPIIVFFLIQFLQIALANLS